MKRFCRSFLGDAVAVLALWALVSVFFWGSALAGRVLAGGDVFTYFYPYWAEATRAFRGGRLPLWNPYLFMGAPFLANSQVGVFYPLNWPLWLLLPAHRSIHLTIVLHLCLAALNTYVWVRRSLRMGWPGAWAAGCAYALGGYLGAQVEHVNQLQGLAWLPLMLVLWDNSNRQIGQATNRQFRISSLSFVALVVIIGLVFLAGHTQTAFITLVGLVAYGFGPRLWRALRWREWRPLVHEAVLLAGAVALGLALAAVQLIPTWELLRLSIRAGGLPFNERISFSLSPFYLARALLPGFAGTVPPEHIEHVAYVGVTGLALAVLAIVNRQTGKPVLLSFLGLFLSLGLYNPVYLFLARFVPGFAHFRVPARWLALYALGMAALVGWGAEALWRRIRLSRRAPPGIAAVLLILAVWGVVGVYIAERERVGWPTVLGWACGIVLTVILLIAAWRAPRFATAGLLALLVVELFVAGSALPYRRATAPQAFTSLRPAIAHLLADPLPSPRAPLLPSARGKTERGWGEEGGASRFLSISDITFDPGDLGEIEIIYGPQLSDAALYDLIVAAKQKEVLSPNLPLAFGVPAVDGYDGGVLPLARYVALQRLLLPEERVSIDGRLRENLTTIPDGRWLNLFNVGYVLTDKLHDAWIDGVFYDLQFGARLAPGESAAVACVPQFEATALGLVSSLDGVPSPADDALVGLVEVGFADGITRTFELRAGQNVTGDEKAIRLHWSPPNTPVAVAVQSLLADGEWIVRGISLIDERTSSFQALVLSDQGRFCLAHSGDVKIYENLDVLPRAFIVHRAVMAESDETALALMQDATFDPATQVVLEGDGVPGPARNGNPAYGEEWAVIKSYQPERVEIAVSLETPGYLVLSDTWYPGWQATVDGERVEIRRANVLFRAVAVDAGEHRIVFTFLPASVRAGGIVSVVGVVCLLAGWLTVLSKVRRDAIMAIARQTERRPG